MRTVIPPRFATEDLQDLLAATLTAARAHRPAAPAAPAGGPARGAPAEPPAPAPSGDADDLWNTPW